MDWEKLNQKREKLNLEEIRIKNQKKLLNLKEKKLKIQKFIRLGEELEKGGWDVLGSNFDQVSEILLAAFSNSKLDHNTLKKHTEALH